MPHVPELDYMSYIACVFTSRFVEALSRAIDRFQADSRRFPHVPGSRFTSVRKEIRRSYRFASACRLVRTLLCSMRVSMRSTPSRCNLAALSPVRHVAPPDRPSRYREIDTDPRTRSDYINLDRTIEILSRHSKKAEDKLLKKSTTKLEGVRTRSLSLSRASSLEASHFSFANLEKVALRPPHLDVSSSCRSKGTSSTAARNSAWKRFENSTCGGKAMARPILARAATEATETAALHA